MSVQAAHRAGDSFVQRKHRFATIPNYMHVRRTVIIEVDHHAKAKNAGNRGHCEYPSTKPKPLGYRKGFRKESLLTEMGGENIFGEPRKLLAPEGPKTARCTGTGDRLGR